MARPPAQPVRAEYFVTRASITRRTGKGPSPFHVGETEAELRRGVAARGVAGEQLWLGNDASRVEFVTCNGRIGEIGYRRYTG